MRAIAISTLTALASCTVLWAAGDQDAGGANRAAPPTKWESRVTDVFFPDARRVLVGTRPDYSAGGAKGGGASGDKAAGTIAAGSSATSAWAKLISAETLQNEVKSLSQVLAEAVRRNRDFWAGGARRPASR